MYPVLCVWNCITAVYVPDRNAANWKYIRCPDADFICGSHVLWGGIYITDPRTEACESAIASLLLSMESCFSVLSGWIILGETLSDERRNRLCVDVCGIILAQLPDKREKIKKWAGIKGLCKYKRQERKNENS